MYMKKYRITKALLSPLNIFAINANTNEIIELVDDIVVSHEVSDFNENKKISLNIKLNENSQVDSVESLDGLGFDSQSLTNSTDMFKINNQNDVPLAIVTDSDFLINQYNYVDDNRRPIGPRVETQFGNFDNSQDSKLINNKFTFDNESEFIYSASDYNDYVENNPISNIPLDNKFIGFSPDRPTSGNIDLRDMSFQVYDTQFTDAHTVTFILVDGTWTTAPTAVKYFVDDLIIEPKAEFEGYTLDGWFANNIKWNFATMGMPDNDLTLKAQWPANKYEIIFNANGGQGSMNNLLATIPLLKQAINLLAGAQIHKLRLLNLII